MRLVYFLLPLLFLPAPALAVTISVYHTSDVHGWYSARPALWDKENSTRLIGGFPALAALVKKDPNPSLLLDSGDMAQGTPEGILTKGMASVELMNLLGYSGAVPGNHDFDYGEPVLSSLTAKTTFPLLAANIYLRGTEQRPSYLKPYAIVERAGKKLAIIGLAGRHTATSTLPEHVLRLEFRDEALEAARLLPEVLAAKPDAIIVLAHLGLSEEFSLKRLDISTRTFEPAPEGTLGIARAAKGIDLLLGGHNHTVLLKGYRDPVSGTVLGESGYGASYATRASLVFDDNTGALKSVMAEAVPLWTDTAGEDSAAIAAIARFAADVELKLGGVVGEAAGDLLFSSSGEDSSIGNWISDLMKARAGTEVALQNTKGIRAEIRKGPVKLRHLYEAIPFDNTLVTMRMTGAQLRRVFADNFRHGRSLMQVSGLEVELRPGSPPEVKLLRNGREVSDSDTLSVATNNYLAFGGDHAEAFAQADKVTDTLVQIRDLALNALKAAPVSPPVTGRLRIKAEVRPGATQP